LSEDERKSSEIERERQAKDGYFKQMSDSPIPYGERQAFAGLKYYPVNASYRFKVKLNEYPSPETIVMSTSAGTQREYLRVGYFEFSLENTQHKLQVYKSPPASGNGKQLLFVPFRDNTSGVETYGAGRYIDIPENETGNYELDFNKAYNPYCAYSEDYVCPMTPPENWLEVWVRAGEKRYKG
jgi:uncharacterized protein (DUF1684 family)